jgi:hypothetical protein
MRDEKQLRHAIQCARAEINQQRAPLALRYLGEIRRDAQDCGIPSLSAEYQLTFAEALAAKNDPASVTEFQDALLQISDLSEPSPLLEMRAHEHFARDLRRKGRLSQAHQHCESAKKLAVVSRLLDDSARIQLLHILITLEMDRDPQIDIFQNLKRVAKDDSFTPQEQLAAWFLFQGDKSEAKKDSLLAARKRGSEEYFRDVLKSVRDGQRDEIPG